jgi:hypothetical protein
MAAGPANTPAGWTRGSPTVTASLRTITTTIKTQLKVMSNNKPNHSKARTTQVRCHEHGTKIIYYLQAGYPGLYLVSPEEQRVEAELKSVLQHLNRNRKQGEQYQLCYWSVIDGLVNTNTQQIHSANDPLEVLQLRWSASGNPPVGGCVF